MIEQVFYERLSEKKLDLCKREAMKHPDMISYLFHIVEKDDTTIKYQAEKVIRLISEEKPIFLYPYFDQMIDLLKHENKFIRLGFIESVPNLLSVDEKQKFKGVVDEYLEFLNSDSIMEFGNLMKELATILKHYPEKETFVMKILFSIEQHEFYHHGELSRDCNEVAKGQILDFFFKNYDSFIQKQEILLFAQKACYSTRAAVGKKARKLLKKYQPVELEHGK